MHSARRQYDVSKANVATHSWVKPRLRSTRERFMYFCNLYLEFTMSMVDKMFEWKILIILTAR